MLILATIFQCLDPVLTIAACLSSKPVFLSPMDKRDEATAYDYSPNSYTFKAEVHLQGPCTICNREKRHSHRCPRVRRMRANPPRKVAQRHARLLLGSTSPSPFPTFLVLLTNERAELYLRHDHPRRQRAAQRPALCARLGRARPSGTARLSAGTQRTRGRTVAAQSAPTRGAVPARRARLPPAPCGEVCARRGRRGRAGRGGARMARDGYARRTRVGAPRQRAVRGDALALWRHRRQL